MRHDQRRIVARVNQLMSLCDELEAGLLRSQADSERLMEAVVGRMLEGDKLWNADCTDGADRQYKVDEYRFQITNLRLSLPKPCGFSTPRTRMPVRWHTCARNRLA